MRIQRTDLPTTITRCVVDRPCPYLSSVGYCDDPRINKGNSDAECHRWSNKKLLEHLGVNHD